MVRATKLVNGGLMDRRLWSDNGVDVVRTHSIGAQRVVPSLPSFFEAPRLMLLTIDNGVISDTLCWGRLGCSTTSEA